MKIPAMGVCAPPGKVDAWKNFPDPDAGLCADLFCNTLRGFRLSFIPKLPIRGSKLRKGWDRKLLGNLLVKASAFNQHFRIELSI